MQAIQVKWHAPSNTRSARYTATAAAGKVTIAVGKIPDGVDHYRYAAEQLCAKFDWDQLGGMLGGMLGGTLADGSQVFVFDHPMSRKEQ